MNIEVIELGVLGRETRGNPDIRCPELEPMLKHFYRTLDDDEQV